MSSTVSIQQRLQELRNKLGEIDKEVVELASMRQEIVAEISELKTGAKIETRDYTQERLVIQNARSHARRLGLSEQVGQDLIATLIQHSLEKQEQHRVCSQGKGAGASALIIGGARGMGRWFLRFLASQGFSVEVSDPRPMDIGVPCHEDWTKLPLDYDLIVVATPLSVTNETLIRLAEKSPASTIFDVASLKSPLREGLAALHSNNCRATSIHPMFGPETAFLSERHVIFVDIGDPEATEEVRNLFSATMAKCVDLDIEKHDRLIAYILGVSHALNLAFTSALADSGEQAVALSQLSSTTFDAQFRVARRVLNDNPSLLYSIQALNDYGKECKADCR